MMQLEGSCHCGKVRYRVASHAPVPFNRCYCTICRKTSGAGGYSINIMGEAATMEVDGMAHVAVYLPEEVERAGETHAGHNKRHFCRHCGSQLWIASDHYPAWVYPVAGSIDTALPAPPFTRHIMQVAKPGWVDPRPGPDDGVFDVYPDDGGLAEVHRRTGWWVE